MVLSQLLAPLLAKALGSFVKPECLEEDSLRVGLWKGHVRLSNICLRDDLLDVLGLPITLRYARIGHIEVEIPWSQLGRQAVVVKVEGVHVLAYAKYQWDEAANARRLAAIKQAQLQAAEGASEAAAAELTGGADSQQQQQQQQLDTSTGSAAGPLPSSGGGMRGNWLLHRLLNQVLDRIRVEVRDVHIRFEDLVSAPSLPYCLGLALHAFALGSNVPSERGGAATPALVIGGGARTEVVKVARVEHAAVYCNPVDEEDLVSMALHALGDDVEVEVMLERLRPRPPDEGKEEEAGPPPWPAPPSSLSLSPSSSPSRPRPGRRKSDDDDEEGEQAVARRFGGHRFLLHPVRGTSYMLLGSSTAPSSEEGGGGRTTRVARAILGLEHVRVTLEDHLLRSLMCLSAGLVRFRTMNRLGLERPRRSPLQDPRAWWRYAYEVVCLKLHEHKGKYDWGAILKRRDARLRYIRLWRERCSGGKGGDEKQQQELARRIADAEALLAYRDILHYRRMAEAQLRAEGVTPTPAPTAGAGAGGGRGGWWRLLRAAEEGDGELAAEATGPAYAALVVRVELALPEGEVRLASSLGAAGEEGALLHHHRRARPTDFLRATLRDLVLRAQWDSGRGLIRAELALVDLRIESHAAAGGSSGGSRNGEEEGGEEQWCRLVSRRIRGASPLPSTGPVFRLTYDKTPVGSPFVADVRLAVDEVEALIVPSAPWLRAVHAFLDLPDLADSWVELEMVALSNLAGIREQLDAKLEYIIQTHPEVRLRADVKGPRVLLLPPADEPNCPQVHLEVETVTLRTLDRDVGRGNGCGNRRGEEQRRPLDDERVVQECEPAQPCPDEKQPQAQQQPAAVRGLTPPPLDFRLYRVSSLNFSGAGVGQEGMESEDDGDGGGHDGDSDEPSAPPTRQATPQPPPTAGPPEALLSPDGLPRRHRLPEGAGLGSSTASVATANASLRAMELDQLYDRLQVEVTGVRVALLPARGHRAIPLLEPLTVMASMAISRLPTDPQMPRLQLAAQTGEVSLKLSGAVLRQLTRLGVASLRTSQRANAEFEVLRRKFGRMAAARSVPRLSSYLNLAGSGSVSLSLDGGGSWGGGSTVHEDEGLVLSRFSSASLPIRGRGGGGRRGPRSASAVVGSGPGDLFASSPANGSMDASDAFHDAHSVLSAGSSLSSVRRPFQQQRRRVGGPACVGARSARTAPSRQGTAPPSVSATTDMGEEEEEEEEEEEDRDEDEEFFDTVEDGYESDEEAFRRAFGRRRLPFLLQQQQQQEGAQGEQGAEGSVPRSGLADVVEDMMRKRRRDQQAEGDPEAVEGGEGEEEGPVHFEYQYKNWRLLRAEFSLPRLQISLWGSTLHGMHAGGSDGFDDDYAEDDDGDGPAEALLTMWAVGFGVRYTAESFLHRLRLRLEDLTVACRGAPPEMPLFRLGAPLPFPGFPPSLNSSAEGEEEPVRMPPGAEAAGQSPFHSQLMRDVSASLHGVHGQDDKAADPAIGMPQRASSPEEGDDPFQLLFQLVRDPDPAATGRAFRSLQSSVRVAALAAHVDQATVADVLRVLAPLCTLAAASAREGQPSTTTTPAAMARAPSPMPLRATTPTPPQQLPFQASGAAGGAMCWRPQAPHVELTLQARGARLALVRGQEATVVLGIGPTAFDLQPREEGATLACALRVRDVELQAIEEGTRYPHRILSHPAGLGGPVIEATALVSTSLVLPPLPAYYLLQSGGGSSGGGGDATTTGAAAQPPLPMCRPADERVEAALGIRGVSIFVPARSLIRLAHATLKGPLAPYLVGEGPFAASSLQPSAVSAPSNSCSSNGVPPAPPSLAVAVAPAKTPPEIKVSLAVKQSSVWLPLQDGPHGEWSDALVLRLDEVEVVYGTRGGGRADSPQQEEQEQDQQQLESPVASLVVKGLELTQSGEEGARPLLALDDAEASVRMPPPSQPQAATMMRAHVRLAQLLGDVDAASLAFLLGLGAHVGQVMVVDWPALVDSPEGRKVMGLLTPSPARRRRLRRAAATGDATATPQPSGRWSPPPMPPSSPPPPPPPDVLSGLGMPFPLEVTLLSGGVQLTVGTGAMAALRAAASSAAAPGAAGANVVNGTSGGGVLVLVAEDLEAMLVARHGAAGLVAEGTVRALRVLLGGKPGQRAESTAASSTAPKSSSLVEVMGPAQPGGGQVGRRERALWEAIRSGSTGLPHWSSSLPIGPEAQAPPPHLWLKVGLEGAPRVAASLGAYLHPTDWTLTLPGLAILHDALQHLGEAVAAAASLHLNPGTTTAAAAAGSAVTPPLSRPPLPRLARRGSLAALLQEVAAAQEEGGEAAERAAQARARERLREMLEAVVPLPLAGVQASMVIGTQNVIILEASPATAAAAATAIPPQQQHALVMQVGLGADASLLPTYGALDGRLLRVNGSLKASGRGWQISLQRLGGVGGGGRRESDGIPPAAFVRSLSSSSSPPPPATIPGSRRASTPPAQKQDLGTGGGGGWGDAIGGRLLEAEQRLVSPIVWEADAGLELSLEEGGDGDGSAESGPLATVEAALRVEPLEAWALFDMRALQGLIASTLQPAAALFAAPSSVTAPTTEGGPFSGREPSPDSGGTGTGMDAAYLVQKLPIPAEEQGFTAATWEAVAPVLRPLDLVKARLTLTLASARLTVVNNLRQPALPLLKATLGPLRMAAEALDGVLEADLGAGLRVKYFNRRLVLWEPLLEPWALEATLTAGYVPFPVWGSVGGGSSSGRAHEQGSSAPSPPRPHQPRQHFASCRLRSAQMANVNVSEAFLENLVAASAALAKVQQQRQQQQQTTAVPSGVGAAERKEDLHLYWIRNDTGVLLRYKAHAGKGFREVGMGEQEPLRLPPPKERLMASTTPGREHGPSAVDGHQGLQLVLQRPGQAPWDPLTHVGVEEEGVRLHAIRTLEGLLWVACEVTRAAGVKVLRVRSTALFENRCSLPLRVALKAGYGVVQWEECLAPGAQVPLPVYLTELEGAALLVSALEENEGAHVVEVAMPMSASDDDEDDETPLRQPKGEKGAGTDLGSTCLDLAGPQASAPLFCVLRVLWDEDGGGSDGADAISGGSHYYGHRRRNHPPSSPDSSGSMTDGRRLRNLRFSPPFVVTNALPVPVDVVLQLLASGKEGERGRGNSAGPAYGLPEEEASRRAVRLRPGEAHPWYGASGQQSVLAWLRLGGFGWSDSAKLRCPPKMRAAGAALEVREARMVDQISGQALRVSLEATVRECMATAVALFVPYWVVNTTDLPLEYAHDVVDTFGGGGDAPSARFAQREALVAGQGPSPSFQGSNVGVAATAAAGAGPGGDRQRSTGLLALLPPPASEAERLLSRAKAQLLMVGYTIPPPAATVAAAASSGTPASEQLPRGTTRLKMRLKGGAPWTRGFALPPATEGLVGFFELRDRPPPTKGLGTRLAQALGLGKERARERLRRSATAGFGLSVSQRAAGGSVFYRTRVVAVAPKFLLVNAFGRALEVKQDGTTEDPALQPLGLPAASDDRPTPFYWARRGGSRQLRVRLAEFGWEWSGRFVPDAAGDTTLALRHALSGGKLLLQVRVALVDASYVVRFRRMSPAFAPYRIENRTLGNLWFVQAGLGGSGSNGAAEREPEALLPYHACTYVWDEPLLPHAIELEWQARELGALQREPLGVFSFNPDLPPRPPNAKGMRVTVETRGSVRMLVVSVDDPNLGGGTSLPLALAPGRLRGAGAEKGEGAVLAASFPSSSAMVWAVDAEVELRGVGLSLLDGQPEELLYASAQDLRLTWGLHGAQSRVGFSVGHFQVDDQLLSTSSPVVFVGESLPSPPSGGAGGATAAGESSSSSSLATTYMTVAADGEVEPVPSHIVAARESAEAREAPHLEVSVEQDLRYAPRVLFFQSVRVGLVPYHVRLDGNLVAALLRLSSGVLGALEEEDGGGGGGGGGVGLSSSNAVPGPAPLAAPVRRASSCEREERDDDAWAEEHAPSSSSSSSTPDPVERVLRETVLRGAAQQPSSRHSKQGATDPLVEEDPQQVFVDSLEVDPVRVQVSFTASSMVSRVVTHLASSGRPGGERFRALKLLLDVVGAALSKVDNAPLRFSPLLVTHAFSADLVARAVAHYSSEALRQAYIVLGTLDVLGNPAKILANISAGLRDFIYEPARGLGQGNLWHFSLGLYRGSASLATRLVLSSLDGVQGLASSLHAGVLPLVGLIEDQGDPTLPPASSSSRALVPRGAGSAGGAYGLQLQQHTVPGTHSLRGLAQGLGALVLEPVRGARTGGVQGLRAGVARGVIAAVLRPVKGALEDTVEVCRVGRAYLLPHLAQAEGLSRVRPPRLFRGPDTPLTLYSAELSLAQDLLRRLGYAGELSMGDGLVFYHVDVEEGRRAVLMTARFLLHVRLPLLDTRGAKRRAKTSGGGGGGGCLLEWALPLASLVQVEALPPATVLLRYLPGPLLEHEHRPSPRALLPPPPMASLSSSSLSTPPQSPTRRAMAACATSPPPSPPSSPLLGPPPPGTTGSLLMHGVGGWLRRTLVQQQQPGLRVAERLLELPDRHAMRRFLLALQQSQGNLRIVMPPPPSVHGEAGAGAELQGGGIPRSLSMLARSLPQTPSRRRHSSLAQGSA